MDEEAGSEGYGFREQCFGCVEGRGPAAKRDYGAVRAPASDSAGG